MSTILLKRSNTSSNDSYTGPLGEITLDTQARRLRLHDGLQAGGFVVANLQDVQDAVDQITGLSISDIDGLSTALSVIEDDVADHEARLTSIEAEYIHKDGSVAFTGSIDLGSNSIDGVKTPTSPNQASNKQYVDDSIGSLGSVFVYVGDITPGETEELALDLTTLESTDAGSYYTSLGSGYIVNGSSASSTYINKDDSIVFDKVGDFRIIDNSNSNVKGTVGYVSVTGTTDDGFVVDLDDEVKGRIEGLESGSVTRVDQTGPITIDNTDPQAPKVGIDDATPSASGAMSNTDKSKLDGIEEGAQVNAVTSVAGKTNDVSLVKDDVGLSKVNNYATANKTQAVAATDSNLHVTPKNVKEFVEEGDYTIDGGTF